MSLRPKPLAILSSWTSASTYGSRLAPAPRRGPPPLGTPRSARKSDSPPDSLRDNEKTKLDRLVQLQNTSELLLQKIPVARGQETVANLPVSCPAQRDGHSRSAQA